MIRNYRQESVNDYNPLSLRERDRVRVGSFSGKYLEDSNHQKKI